MSNVRLKKRQRTWSDFSRTSERVCRAGSILVDRARPKLPWGEAMCAVPAPVIPWMLRHRI
jgi:hypothetical protein